LDDQQDLHVESLAQLCELLEQYSFQNYQIKKHGKYRENIIAPLKEK